MNSNTIKFTIECETQHPRSVAERMVNAAMNALAKLGFRIWIAMEGRRETFTWSWPGGPTVEYDINAAQALIARYPRRVPDGDFSPVFEQLRSGKVEVDWNAIASVPERFDLTRPIIVAELPNGETLPIDGWHRIARAMTIGEHWLPMVLLSQFEVAEISREVAV